MCAFPNLYCTSIIIFINYEHLLKTTQGLPNRVVRVDGIKGRVQAYHAAAEVSNTPWMFTVFAKLKVNLKFDWKN